MTTVPSVSSVPPLAGPSAQPWRFDGPSNFPPRTLAAVSISYAALLASVLLGYFASAGGATAVAAVFASLGTIVLVGAFLALFGLVHAFRAKSLTLFLLSDVPLALNAVLLRHSVAVLFILLSSLVGQQ